jgi:hypothetical protein
MSPVISLSGIVVTEKCDEQQKCNEFDCSSQIQEALCLSADIKDERIAGNVID